MKISIFHTIVLIKFHDFGDKNPRGDEASNEGYENLNISYHCLIKFHDFGDKTQEEMKHQMRGDFTHNSIVLRKGVLPQEATSAYTRTLPLVTMFTCIWSAPCSHGRMDLVQLFFAFLLLLLLLLSLLFFRGSKKKQWLWKKKK